jgi:hypothetical protein
LPLFIYAANTSNNTDIVVSSASWAAFVEGSDAEIGFLNSVSNQKSGLTTEVNILTIKNNTSFASKTNRARLKMKLCNASTDGAGLNDILFRVVRNATLGGSPSYTDVDANTSIVSYDTAGTTVTGGNTLVSFVLSRPTEGFVPEGVLDDIMLNPGDTLTVAASSAASVAVRVALTWKELL